MMGQYLLFFRGGGVGARIETLANNQAPACTKEDIRKKTDFFKGGT